MYHEDAPERTDLETVTMVTTQTRRSEKMSDTPRSRESSEQQMMMRSDEDLVEAVTPSAPEQQISTITHIPETVDDFLRSFLRRAGLNQTLSSFETEWYGSAQKLLTETRTMGEPETAGILFIPDALAHRRLLQRELDSVREETDELRREVQEAAEILVVLQREGIFHQLQARRALEQKDALVEDLKHLKEHLETYESVLRELKETYDALRQNTLLSLQKDRIQNPRLNPEKTRVKEDQSKNGTDKSAEKSPHLKDSEFPVCKSPPCAHLVSEEGKICSSFRLVSSIKAHELPISCVAPHPQKPILASASDDHSWRLWEIPTSGEKASQMLLTGEGHSDWLSACSFHPDGSKLATTSGDTTVRLWDLSLGSCVLTLSGHSQPTWSCSFHSCGVFLASCSADRTAKVWDLNSRRCRLTLRRHTASVNSVCFLPSSNLLLTCSSDRTVVLWDARLGVCSTTLHGHQFPCNHATFSSAAHAVASCDSQGVINLWDTRKPSSPTAAVDAGPLGANHVAFSKSGKLLAVASSDGLVRLVDVETSTVNKLAGHRDAVQSVTFDHNGETLMSAGNDGLINVWS